MSIGRISGYVHLMLRKQVSCLWMHLVDFRWRLLDSLDNTGYQDMAGFGIILTTIWLLVGSCAVTAIRQIVP